MNNKNFNTALEEFTEAHKCSVESHLLDSRYDLRANTNYRMIFAMHAQLFDSNKKIDKKIALNTMKKAVDLFLEYADFYCDNNEKVDKLSDILAEIREVVKNDNVIHLFRQFELPKEVFSSYPKDSMLTKLFLKHQNFFLALINQSANALWENNDYSAAEMFYRMSLNESAKISHYYEEGIFDIDKNVNVVNIQNCLDQQAIVLLKQKKWLDMVKLYVEVVKLYSEIKESLLTPEMIESKRGYEQCILAYFKFYIDDLKSVDNKEKLFSEAYALIKDVDLPDIKRELQTHFDYINNESKRPSM